MTTLNACGIGYKTVKGYDLVTGLGTPKCGMLNNITPVRRVRVTGTLLTCHLSATFTSCCPPSEGSVFPTCQTGSGDTDSKPVDLECDMSPLDPVQSAPLFTDCVNNTQTLLQLGCVLGPDNESVSVTLTAEAGRTCNTSEASLPGDPGQSTQIQVLSFVVPPGDLSAADINPHFLGGAVATSGSLLGTVSVSNDAAP